MIVACGLLTAIGFALAGIFGLYFSPADYYRLEREGMQPVYEGLGSLGDQIKRWILPPGVFTAQEQVGMTKERLLTYTFVFYIGVPIITMAMMGGHPSFVGGVAGVLVGRMLYSAVLWARREAYKQEIRNHLPWLVKLLQVRLAVGDTVDQSVFSLDQALPGAIGREWSKMARFLRSGGHLRDAANHVVEQVRIREWTTLVRTMSRYKHQGVPPEPFANMAENLTRLEITAGQARVQRSAIPMILWALGVVFLTLGAGIGPWGQVTLTKAFKLNGL